MFGSGLAIVPFLHGGVVNQFHWLTERQFLDAVAVAMITPGPVVITVAFIGYLVAGPLGAHRRGGRRLPALLPVRRSSRRPTSGASPTTRRVRRSSTASRAAATGAIAGAAFVLGRRALIDVPTVAIAVATWLVFTRFKKLPEPLVIVAAGVVGLIVHRISSAILAVGRGVQLALREGR